MIVCYCRLPMLTKYKHVLKFPHSMITNEILRKRYLRRTENGRVELGTGQDALREIVNGFSPLIGFISGRRLPNLAAPFDCVIAENRSFDRGIFVLRIQSATKVLKADKRIYTGTILQRNRI